MKKDALISFKCTKQLRDIVLKLATDGDRTVSMQMNKVLREWLIKNGHLKENVKKATH
jgi:hypothetical protein